MFKSLDVITLTGIFYSPPNNNLEVRLLHTYIPDPPDAGYECQSGSGMSGNPRNQEKKLEVFGEGSSESFLRLIDPS
eukprot:3753706-Pyramimonas_sp.AAC.1